MKKFFAIVSGLVLCVTMLVGASACGASDGTTLKIGITYYAPMNYFDESGKLVGFDTEFAEKACAELGLTPQFVEINWKYKQNSLIGKEVDVIWNGMTVKEELREYMAISDAYMENKQVVLVRKADVSKYTDVASLKQATSIAVENGSAGETSVAELGVTVNKMSKQADCLIEVKTGASDIAVLDVTLAKTMTGERSDYGDLTYIDVGFEGEEYGIGVRKEDSKLLADLNALIAKYKSDGTFDSLIQKYMA